MTTRTTKKTPPKLRVKQNRNGNTCYAVAAAIVELLRWTEVWP